MNQDQIAKIEELTNGFAEIGYRLEVTETPTITGAIFKPTPKAKFNKEKMVYGYRFKTLDRAIEAVEEQLGNFLRNIEADAKLKAERKLRNEQEANNVQVGDIFHSSWGFEQTNVNFYQVVAKPSPKTVVLREIAYESVEECSWASDYVKPLENQFIGEEFKMRLNGQWLKFSSYKSATKINKAEDKKFYRSWYY